MEILHEYEREPEENLQLRILQYTSCMNPEETNIRTVAFKLWEAGFSNDPFTNWIEARRRLVSGYEGLPTETEIAVSAFMVWKSGFSEDAEKNWEEGKLQLLASRVWNNPYIRTKIMIFAGRKTMLLGVGKISTLLHDEVRKLLVTIAKIEWRNSGFEKELGRCQVVIDATKGRVVSTPMRGFHPTDAFDMFD